MPGELPPDELGVSDPNATLAASVRAQSARSRANGDTAPQMLAEMSARSSCSATVAPSALANGARCSAADAP